MIFLIVLAGLMYFTKKKVWHEVEKPREIARGQDPEEDRGLTTLECALREGPRSRPFVVCRLV